MASLRPDAGFTTAAVIIPNAMIYAAIAGLPLGAMSPSVLELIKRSPLWERLGDERIFFTLDQAVEHFQRQTAENS